MKENKGGQGDRAYVDRWSGQRRAGCVLEVKSLMVIVKQRSNEVRE